MTSINAKQWLERGRSIAADLDKLYVYRQTLIENAERVTRSYGADVVTFSRDPHKFDKLAECDETINNLTVELLNVQTEIMHVIFRIQDSSCHVLLIARYINCETWAQVSVDMGIAEGYVYRLHKKALNEVELILSGQNVG